MFACNRFETKQIMGGVASGAARKYSECPHKVGAELWLTSKYLDKSGRNIPFARVDIVSIRPGTVGQFRRDAMIAEMDGYKNGEHWFGGMSQMYKGLKDTDAIHHIKFRVKEIDKQAGQRGDVPGQSKK